jgi:hypothetical protein
MDQFGGEVREPIIPSCGIPVLNNNSLSFNIPERTQTFAEYLDVR